MNEIRKAVEQYHREKMVNFLRLFDVGVVIQMAIDYETNYTDPLHDWQYQAMINEIIRNRAVPALEEAREAQAPAPQEEA